MTGVGPVQVELQFKKISILKFRNIEETSSVKKSMLFYKGKWNKVVKTKHQIKQKHSHSHLLTNSGND